MNDEQHFLANAYLDGEVTAEERRIAEADPEVMSEVEQLRALQAELRAIPAADATVRESAIDAAMAQFGAADEAVGSTATPEPAPAAIPLRPRPTAAKYLGIAAAVVAVAALGIIVSRADLGGDDDASSADVAEAPLAEDTAEGGALTESFDSAEATAEEAADMAATVGGDDAGGEAASEVVQDDTQDEAVAEMAADSSAEMDEAAGDGADDTGSAETSRSQRWVVGPDFDPDSPIGDDRDLGIYGVHLLDLRDAQALPPTPNTQCGGDDEILGRATVMLGARPVPAYVGVIETEGVVLARNTTTCAVILVGSVFAD